jgi:hypothetical protein
MPDDDPLPKGATPTNDAEQDGAFRRAAPARFPSGSLLSLADMRAPSIPASLPAETAASAAFAKKDDAGGAPPNEAPCGSPSQLAAEMRARLALDDFSGALTMAEAILALPEVQEGGASEAEGPARAHAFRDEAERCLTRCRSVLETMYLARLAPLTRVPRVEVAPHQLRWLSIDHRAGFLLSLVDGVSSLETICDLSGMTTLDTLRILCELLEKRVISFDR